MLRLESRHVTILGIRDRRIDEYKIHIDFESLIFLFLSGRLLSFDDCRERKHQDYSRNDRGLLSIHPLHLLPAPTWAIRCWRHYKFQFRHISMQLFYQRGTLKIWVVVHFENSG